MLAALAASEYLASLTTLDLGDNAKAALMTRGLAEIDWEDPTEYAPAVVTALAMPLTFSIATGIAFGFILYAAIKLLAGRYGEIRPAMAILALVFLARFAWL